MTTLRLESIAVADEGDYMVALRQEGVDDHDLVRFHIRVTGNDIRVARGDEFMEAFGHVGVQIRPILEAVLRFDAAVHCPLSWRSKTK